VVGIPTVAQLFPIMDSFLSFTEYHQIKNLVLFVLGLAVGYGIAFYFIGTKFLVKIYDDLGNKLQALRFYNEDKSEYITILNKNKTIYLPTFIALLRKKGKMGEHEYIKTTKFGAIIHWGLILVTVASIILAVLLITKIER